MNEAGHQPGIFFIAGYLLFYLPDGGSFFEKDILAHVALSLRELGSSGLFLRTDRKTIFFVHIFNGCIQGNGAFHSSFNHLCVIYSLP